MSSDQEVTPKKEDPESPEVEERPNSPYFVPIVTLPEIVIPVLEEDEDELFCMRAKLYRYDKDADPPQWKERGLGDIKILRHKSGGSHRIIMRREKTYKLCANHYIKPWMKLSPHGNNEKTWMWTVNADYADEEVSSEVLAVRFASPEKAKEFKDVFEQCSSSKAFNTSLDSSLNDTKEELKENGHRQEDDEKTPEKSSKKEEEKLSNKEVKDLEDKVKEICLEQQ